MVFFISCELTRTQFPILFLVSKQKLLELNPTWYFMLPFYHPYNKQVHKKFVLSSQLEISKKVVAHINNSTDTNTIEENGNKDQSQQPLLRPGQSGSTALADLWDRRILWTQLFWFSQIISRRSTWKTKVFCWSS